MKKMVLSATVVLALTVASCGNNNFAADEENTPVKIVSGTTDQTITVGVDWVGSMDYVAGDPTMTVYGNVRRVDCNENKFCFRCFPICILPLIRLQRFSSSL